MVREYLDPFAAKVLEGPPLAAFEHHYLRGVYDELALPYTGEGVQERLLRRGLLGRYPTACGPAVVISALACTLLGEKRRVPDGELAENMLYLQRALRQVQAEGYMVLEVITHGRVLLRRGPVFSQLLARTQDGGHSRWVVRDALRHPDVTRTRGEVIVFAPEPALYARLASRHSRLRVCALALRDPPTTGRTAPARPGSGA